MIGMQSQPKDTLTFEGLAPLSVPPPPSKRRRFWRIAIITVILLGGVGIVAGAIIPCGIGSGRARKMSQRNACINNLRQIDGAKEHWALETRQETGAAPAIEAIDQYIKGGHPTCPAGGTYTYANVDSPPLCSIQEHALPSYK